jgi:hypothetical protein
LATYTQSDLIKIRAIISGGLDQAMIAGEMVRYRSLSDLYKIEAKIEAALAAPGASKPFQVRYTETDRGI